MDEPFGALDALTRAKLQDELLNIAAPARATVWRWRGSAQYLDYRKTVIDFLNTRQAHVEKAA